MKALLLAAGLGTRLRPITDTIPKCLVPINGKPLLEIWLDTLVDAGISEFIINTHYLHDQVETFIESSKYKNQVKLVYEPELLGTAKTVLANKDFFLDKEPFLVIHADNLSICDYKDFISSHYLRPDKCIMTMMTFSPDNLSGCGIVICDEEGIVTNYSEKPEIPLSNIANGAVYIFEPSIFTYFNNINDISTELLPKLIGKIYTYKNVTLHIDVGTRDSFKKAQYLLKKYKNKDKFFNYFFNYFSQNYIFDSYAKKRQEIHSRILMQKQEQYKFKRVLAIYDFIDLPHSNDIMTVLIAAEIERRKYNLEKIDVVFVAHSSDPSPLRHNYVTPQNYKQFIYNLAIEQVRLFKYVGSLFVFDNRNEFVDFYTHNSKYYKIYPYDYQVNLPVESFIKRTSAHQWSNITNSLEQDSSLLCVTPPQDQIVLAQKWILKYCFPKIPITITLREWDDWADERNSKIEEWQKLVTYYSEFDQYIFIVIRDYYKLYDNFDPLQGQNVIYCNEAALSNSFRAALYQEATLNLFVSNGSAMYAVANKNVRYIFFSICSKGRGATRDALRDLLKLYYNESFQGSSVFQKVVWQRDFFDVLKKETEAMINKIKDKNMLLPKYYYKEVDKESYEDNIIQKELQFDLHIPNRYSINYYEIFFKLFYIKKQFSNFIQKIKNINNRITNRIANYTFIKYKILKLSLFTKFLPDVENSSELIPLEKCIRVILNKNKKVIIYGAGTIGEKLYPLLKKNILFYLDNSEKPILGQKSRIKTKILHPDYLYDSSLEFDYIIITPQGREKVIVDLLETKYHIPKQKMVLFL